MPGIPQAEHATATLAAQPSSPPGAAPPRRGTAANWLLGALLLSAWMVLWNKLRVDWATNDQYSYGWSVPPLAIFLLILRWPDRSPPEGGKHGWLLGTLAVAGGFLLLPVRLIEEPNADWRLLAWVHAGLLAAITLAAVAWMGGLPWVRHFGFPVLFLLVAVRWPSGPEQALVQGLMRVVASLAAEAMTLLGIPATHQGNLIRVRGQLVGVDEACSGIRSLQTMLMAGLFLGEMVRLSVPRRLVLLAGGIALALVANTLRGAWLVWLAAERGTGEMQRYHDQAGLAVLIFILAGLVWTNNRLERGQEEKADAPSVDATRPPPAREDTVPPPLWSLAVAGCFLLLAEGVTGWWYGIHERGLTLPPAWTVALPKETPGFREVRIDDVSRNLLRFDEGRAGEWPLLAETLGRATLFFFRWEPGRASASLASLHQPHICLTAAGLDQTADLGTVPCPTRAGVTLPVQRYEFTRRGLKIFVFWVVWQNRPGAEAPSPEPESSWERLKPVRRGERNLGQQTLEVVLTGPRTADEALGIFSRQLQAGLVRAKR